MSVFTEYEKHVMNTYSRFKICIVRGKGAWVWDQENKKYLDATSGIGPCVLGHCHPAVVGALKKQLEKLEHISNLYYNEPQGKLAELLAKQSRLEQCFFSNSGTEANEAALKLAKKATGRKKTVAFTHGFHGRSSGSLSLTWKPRYRKPFMPLLQQTVFAEYNDKKTLSKIDEKTAAVFVEPIQGESGIIPAEQDFMESLRKKCDQTGALLVVDEVQTGLRTGKLFAIQHYGIQADIMTLAKSLGNGFPIGVTLAEKTVAEKFEPGDHASTFGGNPLACTAALATLKHILKNKLHLQAERKGKLFKKLLTQIPQVQEVRGKGLMIGADVKDEAKKKQTLQKCLKLGVLFCGAGEKTIRMLPPLTISEKETETACQSLKKALGKKQ